MDKGLFAKHIHLIGKREQAKAEILTLIKEHSGVSLNEDEISIAKKEITFYTTSVKRLKLIQTKSDLLLKEKGYTVTF